ncbi:MAG: hypothetical protein LBG80_04815 [Bacteroidales bacterium]|jgi:hypothetical protein|nr:hypothetical protein [Bacteroidales bacterium]
MKHNIFSFLICLLLFTCIFDPTGKWLGIKDFLYIFILVLFLLFLGKIYIFPKNVTTYIVSFCLIPILSIIVFFFKNHFALPEFSAYKCFLFLPITFVYINYKTNVLKWLLFWLNALALMTIILNFISLPGDSIYMFGNKYDIFTTNYRQYGTLTYSYAYFHTSPLLVLSLSYYWWRYFQNKKIKDLLWTGIIVLAMFNSGTRNNMLMCIILLFMIWFFQLSLKGKFIGLLVCFCCCSILIFSSDVLDVLSGMFSLQDGSNSLKLVMLADYQREIFKFPDFFIGQGWSSPFWVTIKQSYDPVTELTYLDIIRCYGVIMGGLMIYLMFWPIKILSKHDNSKWLAFAYFGYLIMIIFNPFYFSSNGMILLSIVLYQLYHSSINFNHTKHIL